MNRNAVKERPDTHHNDAGWLLFLSVSHFFASHPSMYMYKSLSPSIDDEENAPGKRSQAEPVVLFSSLPFSRQHPAVFYRNFTGAWFRILHSGQYNKAVQLSAVDRTTAIS
ncbi:MAG: hypothetical protein LUC39_03960 [Clostridiales bacterium]|nr:hypothetical protein [Clostridiales bacterium]